jgi:hypothetical protein
MKNFIYPRAAFGRLALRMGVVSQEDLRLAIALCKSHDGSVERILLRAGALTQELAAHVHAALPFVSARKSA